MISYEPLFKSMKKKNISGYQLVAHYGLSSNTLRRLKAGENVTLRTLEDLCTILQCPIEEIVKIIPDKEYKRR